MNILELAKGKSYGKNYSAIFLCSIFFLLTYLDGEAYLGALVGKGISHFLWLL